MIHNQASAASPPGHGAAVRRWRWPPLKFLPPASTGRRARGLFGARARGLRHSSAAHSSSSVAVVAPGCVARGSAPLTSNALRYGRDHMAQLIERPGAHVGAHYVDAADAWCQQAGMSETSVDLPLPVTADMPTVLPLGSSRVTSIMVSAR